MIEIRGSIVFGIDDVIAEWVRLRVKDIDSIEKMRPFVAIGVLRHGCLAAGIVYNRLSRPDIHATCAADTPYWGSRDVFRTICSYPFWQMDCQRVTCVTGESNAHTRGFLEKFGFAEEGRHPHAFSDGETAISYGLYRNNCRWWKDDGQKFSFAA